MTVLLFAAATDPLPLEAITGITVAPGALFDVIGRTAANTPLGDLRAEIRDADGNVIGPTASPYLETPFDTVLSDYTARLSAPTVPGGTYTVYWVSAEREGGYEPLTVKGWRPTLPDIAVQVRSRNRNGSGVVQQTWNDTTQPTRLEVDRLINMAVSEVTAIIGTDPADENILGQAHDVASLIAARKVEQASDQPRDILLRSWEKDLDRLIPQLRTAVEQAGAGGDPSSVDDTGRPLFSFPAPAGFDSL